MITRQNSSFDEIDFSTGEAVLIDKPLKMSSFSVVYKVRKAVGVKKVGHAGTLDPMATGLLIICTGKKTKEITSFQDMEKTYTGIISLGKRTASMDSETEFEDEKGIEGITEQDILNAKTAFSGKISQLPPMYSAVKHKGKSLYKYARKGREIQREPREVEIYGFDITKIELPDVHFEIRCSKGTYIRVIADDFGAKLGCGGYLKELRRSKIGAYSVEDAFVIEDFVKMTETL